MVTESPLGKVNNAPRRKNEQQGQTVQVGSPWEIFTQEMKLASSVSA